MTNAGKLLLEIYLKFGPKELVDGGIRPVPPKKFARMSRREVNQWNLMPNRFLVQRIAKELAK